jgi:hypothetical protein
VLADKSREDLPGKDKKELRDQLLFDLYTLNP